MTAVRDRVSYEILMRHAIAAVFLLLIAATAAAQATNQTALTEALEHAKAGRVNEAFAALERVVGPAPGVVNALRTSPDFEVLRKDARFNALVEKLTPCTGEQYRHFDFWVGEWEVRSATNQLLGHNRISTRYGGCVVLEEWKPASGDGGSSFNFYDQNTRQWHQFWVDASGTNWLSSDKQGNPVTLRGGIRDGAMVLVSHPDSLPSIGQTRATWRPLKDGRVQQTFESSTDNGKTWTVSFDGFYSKAKKP